MVFSSTKTPERSGDAKWRGIDRPVIFKIKNRKEKNEIIGEIRHELIPLLWVDPQSQPMGSGSAKLREA